MESKTETTVSKVEAIPTPVVDWELIDHRGLVVVPSVCLSVCQRIFRFPPGLMRPAVSQLLRDPTVETRLRAPFRSTVVVDPIRGGGNKRRPVRTRLYCKHVPVYFFRIGIRRSRLP
jgi:hypothetical protein